MRDLIAPTLGSRIARAVLPVALLAALLGAAAPAPAQDAAITPDTVVATVGGEPITEGDLAFAAEDLGQELAGIPAGDRRAFLVTVLIDMKVMAQAAREAGMNESDVFKRRLQYLEDRALRRAYFAERITAAVTPEAVQAAYDELITGFTPEEEVHARHILVQTREDADAIKADLAAGKPFEVLAMEKSIDPSGTQNGGDLGFFSRGMMVRPFEDAAFALTEPGQVSEPIESQFGWHIIKLEERRQSSPPSLAELQPQLQQQVMFQAFNDTVVRLKQTIPIEIPDPVLAAGVQAQSATAQ